MIIKNVGDLDKVINFLDSNEYIAFDIESTGLEPRKDKVIGFGVSNESTGFYIVHLQWDGEKLVEVIPFGECVTILNKIKNINWTGWNSSFEVRFIRHYFGVDLIKSLWSEGMLAKHTVDEERPFQLKEVARKVFGESAADEQIALKKSIKDNGGDIYEYFRADVDILGTYCIQDCLLTFKLNKKYLEEIDLQGTGNFYFKDEVMPLYKEVTIDMEDRGIKLDLDLINSIGSEIASDISRLESEIQLEIKPLLDEFTSWYLNKELPPRRSGEFAQYVCKYADLDLPRTKSGRYSMTAKALDNLPDSVYKSFLLGGEYLSDCIVRDVQDLWYMENGDGYIFNLSSKDHLKRLFFDKLGESPVSKTAKGNPQVDKLFLDLMALKYNWAKTLLEFNSLKKIESAYIIRFLDSNIDGVFYPSFFQHRTISGRYGSDIQQLPRPKEVGEASELVLKYNNAVRKFFVSRDGYAFIDSDYESLEPHVFAHVSGDEGLKNIFRNGHDFYSTIAIQTEGLEGVSADKSAENYLGKVNKVVRQKAKAYSLGVPYGLGGYALSKRLEINQSDADKLISDYLNAFPDLKAWMEDSFNQCITNGMVKSQAGRIRHMPKAPKIWYAHSSYILDNLKLWKKYNDSPKKYAQMKFLAKEMSNYVNNSRNFQIQSLAASITNRACIAINRELRRQNIDGLVIAQIHDQIIVEVPRRDAEKCKKVIQFLMENTYKLSLKLKAPAELGFDFYEAH